MLAGMGFLEELLDRARRLGPLRLAVVLPLDDRSLLGAAAAEAEGIATPVLVGPKAAIVAAAAACGAPAAAWRIVDAPPEHAAAAAAELAAAGEADALAKGAIHSDIFLHAVLTEPRLRTQARLSHVVVTELAARNTPLLLTDGAVNLAPDLDEKVAIVRNAIGVAHAVGIEMPRVAILAAVETVASTMPATLDAAALAEMASRGQITGGIVDGPLALDDAIDPEAARAKGIRSPAAGCADVLVAPNLEAGNLLFKAFDVLLRARFGAVVAGAAVPLLLTSRADSPQARLYSGAIARFMKG